MTDVTLHLGDCLSYMRTMSDRSVDLTVTSPPYDNLREYGGHSWDFERIAEQLFRVTDVGGVVVWVVADATINGSETGTSFRHALYFKGVGFYIHDTMIYKIKGTGAKGSNLGYWQAFEFMFVLSRGRPKSINLLRDRKNKTVGGVSRGRNTKPDGTHGTVTNVITQEFGRRDNVWEYQPGNGEYAGHPAVFPVALAKDHVLSWSNPGSTIFDPFMGSGTTGVACVQTGRNFIGCEIDPGYFAIAEKRIKEAQMQLRLDV